MVLSNILHNLVGICLNTMILKISELLRLMLKFVWIYFYNFIYHNKLKDLFFCVGGGVDLFVFAIIIPAACMFRFDVIFILD